MIKPNSPLGPITVTISIPKVGYLEIPYLAGRWRCTIDRSDYPEGSSRLFLRCFLKEKQNVRISADVGCDNGYIRDTKENRMEGLSVDVYNNNVDKALRILKKKVKDANLFFDLRKKEYYEKPSKKRREKKNLAKLRNKYANEKVEKNH